MRNPKIEAVENGLQRRRQTPGEAPKNILARMQELRVPNASISIIANGDVWSRDYDSVAQTASDQSVDGHAPVFQAGSISKTVNAVLAMKLLVESGKIKIDDDLTLLLSEKMGVANPYTGKPITLAQLLSHTAGTTVHGGAGYATNTKRIPSTAEILAGNAELKGNPPEAKDTHIPNTGPIEVVREPGKECVYSGGGITIVQRLIELEYPNESYASLAKRYIFEPLGMTQSTFELQKPENNPVKHIKKGHGRDGRVIEGGWRMMPESAAGGLWTTSSDLAKFAIAIYQMSLGNTNNSILKPATVQQMLAKQPNASLPNASFGLGFVIYGEGDAVSFGHDGRMIGYSAEYIFFPRTGMGAVILTNSENGGNNLIEEIYCSIAENYGWAHHGSEVLQPVSLTDAAAVELPVVDQPIQPNTATRSLPAVLAQQTASVVSERDRVSAAVMPPSSYSDRILIDAIPDFAGGVRDSASVAVLAHRGGFISQSTAAQRAQLDMAVADSVDQKNDTTPAPGK